MLHHGFKKEMLLLLLDATTKIRCAKSFCHENADDDYKYRNCKVGIRELTAATAHTKKNVAIEKLEKRYKPEKNANVIAKFFQ